MAVDEGEIIKNLTIGIKREPVTNAVYVAIESWQKEWVALARALFLRNSLSKSGTLAQTIVAMPIKQNGTTYSIEINAAEAVDFVDKGVNGTRSAFSTPYSFKSAKPTFAHIKAIQSWQPAIRMYSGSKNKTFDQVAYAIATTSRKHGIKPKNFLNNTINSNSSKADLGHALSVALAKSIQIKFKEIANKHK